MARYNFTAGAILSFNHERIKFLHIANDDADTHVFEKEDGLELELPSDVVLAEMQVGRLYQIPDLALKRSKVIDNLNANDNERAAARWRARFVRRWLDKGAPKLSARNLHPIIQEVRNEIDDGPRDHPDRLRRPPAWNTLVRWIQAYRRGTGSVGSLLSQGRLAGNRKRKIDTQIGELLEETIWDEYLVRNGPSIHKVWSDLLDRLAITNAQRMKRREPLVPHISYSTMQRAIKELCPFIVDCCRKGPEIAKREWRSRGGGYVTDRANERWQIDHTQCDVHAISEFDNQPIGRPWLTVVVDVHTRMIMSAVISYSAPDEGAVLLALKRAILGMGLHWPAAGSMDTEFSLNWPSARTP